MTLQDEARELIAAATLWPWTDGTPAPELLAALCEQLDHAEAAAADWKATAEDREATIDEYREHAAAIADRAKKAEAAIDLTKAYLTDPLSWFVPSVVMATSGPSRDAAMVPVDQVLQKLEGGE